MKVFDKLPRFYVKVQIRGAGCIGINGRITEKLHVMQEFSHFLYGDEASFNQVLHVVEDERV